MACGHTPLLTSALHQGANQRGGEIDWNGIADLLGDFGLVAGEFIRRLRVREAHRAGELFRLEHAEPDVVLSPLDHRLGDGQLNASRGADRRGRLVDRVDSRRLALALAKRRDDAGELPTGRAHGLKVHAVRTGNRGKRLLEQSEPARVAAVRNGMTSPNLALVVTVGSGEDTPLQVSPLPEP